MDGISDDMAAIPAGSTGRRLEHELCGTNLWNGLTWKLGLVVYPWSEELGGLESDGYRQSGEGMRYEDYDKTPLALVCSPFTMPAIQNGK